MSGLLILPLGFAPGLFLLWYFYHKSIYHPEPKRLVARTFAIGMAVTIPAAIAEALLLPHELMKLDTIALQSVAAFLVVGPVEEGVKFLTVRLGPFKFFDEPVDGIIYAAAAALGFATVENIVYMFQYGWEVILLRGPISTIAHVLFAVPAGYYLGLKAVGRASWFAVALALLVAMSLHGAFDFFLFTRSASGLLSIPLVIVAGVWTNHAIRSAQATSPLRGKLTSIFVRCPRCASRELAMHDFCSRCGAVLAASSNLVVLCGNCSAINTPHASYCTTCGYRLLRTGAP